MNIVISPASEAPIYRQIFEQLSAQIVRGELASGDCLPPIRVIAAQLRVSVITVKKAWEELERKGFIYTQAGRGCFVASLPESQRSDKREALVTERLKREIDYCRTLGMTQEEIVEQVKLAFKQKG